MSNQSSEERTSIEIIDKLIEGYNAQSQMVSRVWLTLAVICTISIIPPSGDVINVDIIGISIEPQKYYALATILIVVFLIGFASSNSQLIRTRKLIGHIQREYKDNNCNLPANIDVQHYIDSSVLSAFNRIAPIAQILQGKKQFKQNSRTKFEFKLILVAYYICIKKITYLLIYGLPAYALSSCFFKREEEAFGVPNLIFWIFFILGLILLIQLLLTDIVETVSSSRRIMNEYTEMSNEDFVKLPKWLKKYF